MSKKREAAAYSAGGLVAMFVAGLQAFASGLFSPSWLIAHTGMWFPATTAVTTLVGPNLLPSIPWTLFTVVAAVAFVIALIIKQGKRKS